MKVLPGPSSIKLAKNVAEGLNLPLLNLDTKRFYDGETYLRVEGDVKNERIIIIQTTDEPQEKHFLEVCFLSKTVKELGAKEVIAIIPYLCYARADRRRLEGEVKSHQISLQLLGEAGVDQLLTCNVHNEQAYIEPSDGLKKKNLNLFQHLNKYIENLPLDNLFIVGPDQGALIDVKKVAKTLSVPYGCFEKHRDPETHEVKMKNPGLELKDKDVILIDDVVTSGGTASKAIKYILENEPRSVSFIVIHAMSERQVFKNMNNLGLKYLLSTNTIPRDDIEQIDITPFLTEFIKEHYV